MKKILQLTGLLLLSGLLAVSCNNISSCSSGNAPKGRKWSPDSGRAPQIGDEYLNETDGTVLVWIPSGEFYMGSDDGDEDARPRHKQEVEGFWLGKYEITNEQFTKFIESGADAWHISPYIVEDGYNAPKQPVTGVRFFDALAYCDWAGLRLPTEVEWEYAAAAGKRQLEYPTEDGSIDHDRANYAGTGGTDKWLDTPAPVGSFPAHPFGLYDMAGNVWEWTSSLYHAYPYMAGDGREDLNARELRVMRGGCWEFSKAYCTSTNRHHFEMHLRYDFSGMRLAKTFTMK